MREVFLSQVSRLPKLYQASQLGYLEAAYMRGRRDAIPKPISDVPEANRQAWRSSNEGLVRGYPGPMQAKLLQVMNTVACNAFWEGYNVGRSPQDT